MGKYYANKSHTSREIPKKKAQNMRLIKKIKI